MIKQPNNELWYMTSNKRAVNIDCSHEFYGKIISNEYANGNGVIKFKRDLTSIAAYTFWGWDNLIALRIPASVKHISKKMAVGCYQIKILEVDEGNKYYDSRNNCNAIIETATNKLMIGCKNTVIPGSVMWIGREAFMSCFDLKTIKIPNSVEKIGDLAFSYCISLTSITLPSSLKKIGKKAFHECKFTLPQIKNNSRLNEKRNNYWGAEIYDVIQEDGLCINGNEAITHRGFPKVITIPTVVTCLRQQVFENCQFTRIFIPKTVTQIEPGAFMSCSKLKELSVEAGNPRYDSRNNCNGIIETATNTLVVGCKKTIIPDTVTCVGKDAFGSGCTIKSIVIPNSVVSIEDSAFYACCELKSITIPHSVKTLGADVFADCAQLNKLYVCWKHPIEVDGNVFPHNGYHGEGMILLTLYVPKDTAELYRSAPVWKDFAEIKEWNAPE